MQKKELKLETGRPSVIFLSPIPPPFLFLLRLSKF